MVAPCMPVAAVPLDSRGTAPLDSLVEQAVVGSAILQATGGPTGKGLVQDMCIKGGRQGRVWYSSHVDCVSALRIGIAYCLSRPTAPQHCL